MWCEESRKGMGGCVGGWVGGFNYDSWWWEMVQCVLEGVGR